MTKPRPFTGYFEFPNSQPFTIEDKGITYPTVEHYYQAQKTDDNELRRRIASTETPAMAKSMAKRIPAKMSRKDWMKIRTFVMRPALEVKFHEGTKYHNDLMEIWYPLVAYNEDHDNFWGHCLCKLCIGKSFENHLGKMLDNIRLRWQYEYFARRKAYANNLKEEKSKWIL